MTLDLGESLQKHLGTRSANLFAKLEVHTLGDLFRYYPRRYVQPGELTDLATLREGDNVTIQVKVLSVNSRRMRQRRGTITDLVVTDGTTEGRITFFNLPMRQGLFHPGTEAVFAGKVGLYRGQLQLASPIHLDFEDDAASDPLAAALLTRPLPIYRATAKLGTMTIWRTIRTLMDTLDVDSLADPIPEELRAAHDLPSLPEALMAVHRPMSSGHAQTAIARFRYEEALALQTALARRRHIARLQTARSRPGLVTGGLQASLDARLPFELTRSQKSVGLEISSELAESRPMHRLLHGEVGSGKTLVALRAMLQVVDSGGQAAFLAPTEVLAAQHYHSMRAMLGELGEGTVLAGMGADGDGEPRTRVGLLTGSMTASAKQRTLLDLVTGDIGILVGTHALISKSVTFNDLGLVVVDEQHRFGVEQRDALRAKTSDGSAPHTLVMTATPIPRTVAMTVFGDLDVSTLTDLPGGRKDIATHLVPAGREAWIARMWQRVREQIDQGRQAFVVAPRISAGEPDDVDGQEADLGGLAESDDAPDSVEKIPLNAVNEVIGELAAMAVLAGIRLGVLHGKMPPDEKEAVMARFTAKEIDLLVSTTVIEVGVDVANASVMVILDSDRFGIAQLHQLRGRVGRGAFPGLCFLVTTMAEDSPTYDRLRAVEGTLDGFELSRVDVAGRREGDVLGSAQSGGKSSLKLLRVLQDEKVIVQARNDAAALVDDDPDLRAHPRLAGLIDELLTETNEEYLERG